jgi:hypothetical protein
VSCRASLLRYKEVDVVLHIRRHQHKGSIRGVHQLLGKLVDLRVSRPFDGIVLPLLTRLMPYVIGQLLFSSHLEHFDFASFLLL